MIIYRFSGIKPFWRMKIQSIPQTFILPVLIAMIAASCADPPESALVGPIGPVGPVGEMGPKPMDGSVSNNAIVIDNSDQLVSREYQVNKVNEIEINGLELTIKQGDDYLLTINVEKNLLDYVLVEQEGTKLKIGLDPTRTYQMVDIRQKSEIILPNLTAITVNGIGKGEIEYFRFDEDLDLVIGDLGVLRGTLEAKDIRLDISSLNPVVLEGSAENLLIVGHGLCEIDISRLKTAEVDVNSGQSCKITD